MKICEIISVGTELLLGNIIDTNQAWLSEKLAENGISVYFRQTCGDSAERMKIAFLTAFERSDIVIITGGLGPTYDDITKKTVSEALGMKLIEDKRSLERIEKYFADRNRIMAEENKFQALIPDGGEAIDNDFGTAPGIHIRYSGKDIFMMPGVPFEMKEMFEKKVLPFIAGDSALSSLNLNLCGIAESKADEILHDIMVSSSDPTLAPYAKTGEVKLRITASGKNDAERNSKIDAMLRNIIPIIGEYVYNIGDTSLEETLVCRFAEDHLKISCAESMTGGLIAERITSVSGSSDVISASFITYSEDSKMELVGVKKETLDKFSVYSREVALEMAHGARIKGKSDVGIGITGVAGPSGATELCPIGGVFIAAVTEDKEICDKFIFGKKRDINRFLAASKALEMALRITNNYNYFK